MEKETNLKKALHYKFIFFLLIHSWWKGECVFSRFFIFVLRSESLPLNTFLYCWVIFSILLEIFIQNTLCWNKLHFIPSKTFEFDLHNGIHILDDLEFKLTLGNLLICIVEQFSLLYPDSVIFLAFYKKICSTAL